jgi:exodeoxyribonuclease V gamma subunit
MQQLITQTTTPEPLEIARAEGRLPHGEPGRISYDDVYNEAQDIADAVRDFQNGSLPASLPVQERLADFTITGVLNPIFTAGQLCYRYGHMRGVDMVDAWLRHLLWCRMTDRPSQCVTLIINRDGRRRFRPVDEVGTRLKELLAIYRQAGHSPIPLFPRASWQYALLRFEKGLAAETALDRVRSQWNQSYAMPGEAEDPYIQNCFVNVEPLDVTFVKMTEALYGPILKNSEPV